MAEPTFVFSNEFLKHIGKLLTDDKNELKHENYKTSVAHAEEMSWHVYGTKPETLLKRVRPREDPSITNYRLECYEPITKSMCKKALSIVHKIFNPTLFAINFDNNDRAKKLKTYTIEEYPRFNSVVNYIANYVLKKMIADPNGILLVQPYDYEIKEFERIEPIATCYHSKDIWLRSEQMILLFDGKDSDQEWKFTYVDKIYIIKFILRVIKKAMPISVEAIYLSEYIHECNELPLWNLGGEYSENKVDVLESFFFPAVPFWNEAINDHSDVCGAYRMHLWPQRWEVQDECEYVEENDGNRFACQGGYIFNGKVKHKCSECSGSGYKVAKSPYETHIVNRDKLTSGDGNFNPQPPLGYIDVPVEATKMLEIKAERNLEKGMNALSMDVLNEIGLNQSGKAKEMDRTELNDFLQRIADMCFEIHLTNIFFFFSKYMFGVEMGNENTPGPDDTKIEPQVVKPTQFNIYTTGQLTEMLAQAKTAKLNVSYIQAKQVEIQNKEFQTNPKFLQLLNLELELDPLAENTRDEISMMLMNGTIKKEVAVIHDNIRMFVRIAIEQDKDFPNKEFEEQMEVLNKLASEVVAANKIVVDENAIEKEDDTGSAGKPN